MAKQVPVADGLFTCSSEPSEPSEPSDEPRLIGSEHDGVLSFPARPGQTPRLLGRRGRLWSFTTQQFRPPSPPYDGDDGPGADASFVPYSLGYVELPGELLVQARFTEPDPAKLRIGQEMELRIIPYTTRPDGTEVLTYAFAPIEED